LIGLKKHCNNKFYIFTSDFFVNIVLIIKIQINMKRIYLLLLIIGILTLSSCVKYMEVKIPKIAQSEKKPDKVLLFIDCSASMKGFFNKDFKVQGAAKLLSDIKNAFDGEGTNVEYYKFNKNIDSISDFNGLLNSKTFNCGQNLFSAPFGSFSQKVSNNQVTIIITDAVISTSGTNKERSQEYNNILTALTKDKKNNGNNFGLFHYVFDFNGTYYPQPSDKPIATGDVKRNFYLFSLANPKFNSFLNKTIISKNRPDNYQYFTQAYNDFIKIKLVKEPTLVVNNKFSILMNVDEKATALSLEKLKDNIEILSKENVVLEKAVIQVEASDQDNEFIIKIDLNNVDFAKYKINKEDQFKLRLKEKAKIKPEIQALNYDVPKEPTKIDEIDHSKTYNLDIILKALQACYKDNYVYETTFSVVKSQKTSMFAWFYVPIWGQSKDTSWVDTIYSRIFWLWIIIPLIYVLFFYFSKMFDNNTFRAKKMWFVFGGIVSPLTTFFITLIISFISTSEILRIITHSLQNMIAAIISFIIFTLIFKKFNQNLINTPF